MQYNWKKIAHNMTFADWYIYIQKEKKTTFYNVCVRGRTFWFIRISPCCDNIFVRDLCVYCVCSSVYVCVLLVIFQSKLTIKYWTTAILKLAIVFLVSSITVKKHKISIQILESQHYSLCNRNTHTHQNNNTEQKKKRRTRKN